MDVRAVHRITWYVHEMPSADLGIFVLKFKGWPTEQASGHVHGISYAAHGITLPNGQKIIILKEKKGRGLYWCQL